MGIFKKSSKIQKVQKVYKSHRWSIGLGVFLLGSVFFIGMVNHASALATNISTDPAALEEIKFDPVPATENLAGIGNAELYGALYGCDQIAPLTGSIGSLTTVVQNFTSGVTQSEYACAQQKIKEGTLSPSSFYYQLQRNAGLNSYARMATVVLLDQKPASGRSYIEQKVYALSHLGQVSAQNAAPNVAYYYPGTGYSLLTPIQDFWGWSVNIVYGFLIILIIIVAFGIMFRSKLGGGAVVTLQSAIPSIAMAMVLVPLSYAISGLAIDFITLGTNVTHEFIMGPGAPAREVYTLRPPYFKADGTPTGNTKGEIDVKVPLLGIDSGFNIQDRGYYADDTRVTWYSSWNLVNVSEPVETLLSNSVIFDNDIMKFINDIVGFLSSLKGFNVSLTGGVQFGQKATLQAWIGDIINFFVQILLLFTGLRIFWLLVRKFFVLLISPIFSPFIFATVAIPGTGLKNVMTYGKSLYVASMFYIITYTMFLISLIFSSASFQSSIPDFANSGYVPPLLGIGPLLDVLTKDNQVGPAGTTGFILSLLAVIVYLQIPKVLNDFDRKMGTDKNSLAPMLNSTLESARYSYSVGRGTQRFASNLPGQIANQIDRHILGKEPGEEGSIRGYIRRTNAGLSARLNRTAESGKGVGAVAARAALAAQGAVNRISGSNPQGAENPAENVEISAEIVWNGTNEITGGGFVKWTREYVDDIISKYNNNTAKIEFNLAIKISVKNGRLPQRLTAGNTSIMSVDSSGRVSGVSLIKSFRNNQDWFDIEAITRNIASRKGLNTYMKVYANNIDSGLFVEDRGTKASIKLTIEIKRPYDFFGYNPVTNTYDLSKSVLNSVDGIKGNYIAFGFGPNKNSNVFLLGFNLKM